MHCFHDFWNSTASVNLNVAGIYERWFHLVEINAQSKRIQKRLFCFYQLFRKDRHNWPFTWMVYSENIKTFERTFSHYPAVLATYHYIRDVIRKKAFRYNIIIFEMNTQGFEYRGIDLRKREKMQGRTNLVSFFFTAFFTLTKTSCTIFFINHYLFHLSITYIIEGFAMRIIKIAFQFFLQKHENVPIDYATHHDADLIDRIYSESKSFANSSKLG